MSGIEQNMFKVYVRRKIKRRYNTVSISSCSEKSNAIQHHDLSLPALGVRTMRGSKKWLTTIFIVFSWRINTRIRPVSLCLRHNIRLCGGNLCLIIRCKALYLRSLISPTPLSFHVLLPVPLSSIVSPKRNNFPRLNKWKFNSRLNCGSA